MNENSEPVYIFGTNFLNWAKVFCGEYFVFSKVSACCHDYTFTMATKISITSVSQTVCINQMSAP